MPRLTSLTTLTSPPSRSTAASARTRGQVLPAERFAFNVRPSVIDGQGVFAAEPIPARSKLGELRGESISVQEARRRAKGRARIHIVAVSETRAVDATASITALRHINHSCSPNTVLRISQGRVEFYAMHELAVGEELTCDYGESHHEGRLDCRCRAPNCSGKL